MMKFNDFLRYEITLNIDYEDYFRLIYETKYLLEEINDAESSQRFLK